ncbi:MAG TPA: zf-HC2 domain-containing protein [Nitrospiria bacterium]|nr:zf-HC2 domain-containing protein [Nitrospiria bacterium]
MYDCREIRQLVHASLDRELDVTASLLVQDHVAWCGACREILLDEQTFLTLTTIVLEPPRAPDRTRSAVRETLSREVASVQRTRRRRHGLLSRGTLAAGLVLAVFFSVPHMRVPDLVKIAVAEHRLYLQDPARLPLATSDVREAQHWLDRRLPFSARIPDRTTPRARLVGASARTGPNASAILTYTWDGMPISLLIAPARTVQFSGADAVTFRNVVFQTALVESRRVLRWSDDRHTYVMVACGDVPIESLPFAVP